MEIREIEDKIIQLSGNNPDFYNKLKPTGKKSKGVRNPDLRKLAKQIAKDDYRKFLDENPLDSFEMDMLYAYVLGYAKDDIDILLEYFDSFVSKVEDWAVNDALCCDFKIARKHQEKTWDILMKYKDSKKEFEVRVVAVMILSHFLNDIYLEKSFHVLNNLYHEDYYAKMGLAWAIAEAMAKFPKETSDFMLSKDNKLDTWTYKKALQKMKESRRVDKEMLYLLMAKINKNNMI